jgi:hypothetical protein
VSCASVSLCVAVDNVGDILTSTNPTGGASAWHMAVSGEGGGVGIACPSTTLCVAGLDGSGILTSTNPTGGPGAWNASSFAGGLGAISCPSTSLCVATTAYGGNGIATSTDPAGGGATWSLARLPDTFLDRISCPSASLCVVVGGEGQIITSTNPTGGASAWSTANVDVASCAPCIAEQLYAHDNQGTRIIDSAPAGSGTAIANVQLTGDELTWTHDGTPLELTLQ